jgi:Heterokaryon incompatibility protein (HET)
MWLLHSSELRFEQFYGSSTPPYAILSHRWGDDEISLQDLQAAIKDKASVNHGAFLATNFWKIQKTREEASASDIDWVWIDTCCINKESSAELSEAINSMYKWYQNAKICYAYMFDVVWAAENSDITVGHDLSYAAEPDADSPGLSLNTMTTMEAAISNVTNATSFQNSSWFSRGWTLQELLAPRTIKFFDSGWNFIGMKAELVSYIAERSGIDAGFIEARIALEQASVAEKMSWVSRRQTTREEDMAYCLLGIFDVNMPLLYGEGKKAFMRLQLEIIRKSDDESIFAWRREPNNWRPREQVQLLEHKKQESGLRKRAKRGSYKAQPFKPHSGLLAEEPEEFTRSGHIQWKREKKFVRRLPYTMTNQGLCFYVEVFQSQIQGVKEGGTFDIELNCYETQTAQMDDGSQRQVDKPIVISLRKEGSDNDQAWRRHDCLNFQGPIWGENVPMDSQKTQVAFYIRQDGL